MKLIGGWNALCFLALGMMSVVFASSASPKAVGIQFKRKRAPPGALSRRSNVDVPLLNTQNSFIYVANVSVGMPPQNVSMQIDTGSSDFWINTPDSVQCTQRSCPLGTYSVNASTTSKYLNSNFLATYAVDGKATGDFITEDVSFAGVTIKGLEMGVGYNSTCLVNMWGISYPAAEAVVAFNLNGTYNTAAMYNNSVLQMVSQGLIQSPAYSLWMNDVAASAGSILFGAFDTAKFQGSLQVLPVETSPLSGRLDTLIVNVTSVSLSTGGGVPLSDRATEFPQPAMLDTGTPTITVPTDVFTNIASQLNVTVVQGIPLCDCGLANSTTTVDFGFAGLNISIPLKSIVQTPTTVDLELFAHTSQQLPPGVCVFGISSLETANIGVMLLGDSFLRSAYVVYDLANNKIGMAATNFNPTGSSIVEIAAGSGGIAAALSASASSSPTASGPIPSATGTGSSAPVSTTITAGGSRVRGEGAQLLMLLGALTGLAFWAMW
ncbi:hypothetical protein MMC26_005589 [Xylographa opegraphella]|nr:hypothetical protein [Xylographa opegraphella]